MWHDINGIWEYNDSPPAPDPANEGQYNLWLLQTDGIRGTAPDTQIYVACRMIAYPDVTGELNKTFYDNLP